MTGLHVNPLPIFSINADGTLVLLEAARQYAPETTFIFMSTNKVYGDSANQLPMVEKETRWEVDEHHFYFEHGIDETMSVDQSKHSLFGVSKLAADIMVQEYARYFGMKTGIFRAGCITGPAHSSAELHGFIAYLVKCTLTGKNYTIYGYSGKQVRDIIHAHDLASSFWHFYQQPRAGEVYNIGGSRYSHCSLLEAVSMVEELSGKKLNYTFSNQARSGDHIWWISDVRRFQKHYQKWSYSYNLKQIIQEVIQANV